jgi:hypothetical protein
VGRALGWKASLVGHDHIGWNGMVRYLVSTVSWEHDTHTHTDRYKQSDRMLST